MDGPLAFPQHSALRLLGLAGLTNTHYYLGGAINKEPSVSKPRATNSKSSLASHVGSRDLENQPYAHVGQKENCVALFDTEGTDNDVDCNNGYFAAIRSPFC